ncbi:MAG TPA: bifunctional metallophosphatase/5'-nucleotidase [Polyangiaceae bacterium]|nr:bifunctional metallophosphatase/5'-nucleotidase [Polyangiaceae bacterium]
MRHPFRHPIALTLAALAVAGAPFAVSCNGDDTLILIHSSPGGDNDAASVDATVDASSGDAAQSVKIQILGINDFHGNLDPPSGNSGNVTASPGDPEAGDAGTRVDGSATQQVPAGGVAYLAAHIAALKAQYPNNTAIVSAGDLTGASPFVSQAFHDEPSVVIMNAIGLDFNGVGNHEFDHGVAELRRLQYGGCYPGACDDGGTSDFPGAKFEYLAANVDVAKGRTVFPPYDFKELGGEKIAFIGMTLKDTPSVTIPSAVAGLTFDDEVQTVNALVPEIRQKGASAIVVLLHQGDVPPAGTVYNGCGLVDGVLADIATKLDPAVDVVLSAHTHQAYECTIAGKLVTSAASYGRVVTQVELTIDPVRHRVTSKTATNHIVTRNVAPDSKVATIVADYKDRVAAVANQIVGNISGAGSLQAAPPDPVKGSGESTLGDVIADSMLASTTAAPFNADFAVMNPGGIRADLPDSAITYAQAFAVEPFGNYLVTVSLTGAQIETMLNEQWTSTSTNILQISKGLTYTYVVPDGGVPHVVAGSIVLGTTGIELNKIYRVTTNNFVASGTGDGFTIFKQATDRTTGASNIVDLDSLIAYFHQVRPTPPPPLDRITRQ